MAPDRIQSLTLLLLLVWLYHSIVYRLVVQWGQDPNVSHGYFVPVFALYVLWCNRDKLKAVRPAPSWSGISIAILGLVMLVLGVLGVELFTERVSLLILLPGLIVMFLGWSFFRAVLFPWAFLFLMIPLPSLIMQRITFPLQLLASELATSMLRGVGIAVNLEGNVINMAFTQLEVIEACSGIHSLFALVTLAIIYGYLLEKRIWVRVVLVCSALPIAVFANGFRVFATGFLAKYWDPETVKGKFHEIQGLFIFVISLLLLFAVHSVINRVSKAPAVEGDAMKPVPRDSAGDQDRGPGWSIRFLVVAALLFATAIGLQLHSRNELVPPRLPLSSVPAEISGWTGSDAPPLDEESLDILGHPEYVLRDYANDSLPGPKVELFVAYYSTQKVGESTHSPAHCLLGAGWMPISRKIVRISAPDGTSFPVNRFVVSQEDKRTLALYWFQAHGRRVASEYRLKYYLVTDSIRKHRSDGALIRLMTPMYSGESAEDAQARVMRFGDKLLPLLEHYIPN